MTESMTYLQAIRLVDKAERAYPCMETALPDRRLEVVCEWIPYKELIRKLKAVKPC